MDDQCNSVDSEAAAPLVFTVEQPDRTDAVAVRIRNESGRASRTHQKLSLSTYESLCQSGEFTSDQAKERMTDSTKLNGADPDISSSTSLNDDVIIPQTSTPAKYDIDAASLILPGALSSLTISDNIETSTVDDRCAGTSSVRQESVRLDPRTIKVPVVGYETLPQRTRFTVYKLHVRRGSTDNWFVFRRYSDFIYLQRKLKLLYPLFYLPLPPRRWFRDNYEEQFLDERKHGLQSFIDSIIRHENLCNCSPVQEFFCFSDPPGPYDSVEQSRAYCEALEEANYELKMKVRERDTEIDLLRDELALYKKQVELLSRALREQTISGAANSSSSAGTSLMAELNQSESSSQLNSSANSAMKGRTSNRIDQPNTSLYNGYHGYHTGAASGYMDYRPDNGVRFLNQTSARNN